LKLGREIANLSIKIRKMPTTTIPTGNHFISVAAAAEMTSRFRANTATVLKTEYANADILANCETFNKAAFDVYMNNSDCKAIRIYYGMDANLKVHAILVGVNEANEDMLPVSTLTEEDDPLLREDAVRCPPGCPEPSVLNED
jgi:hypothetical protein